MKSGINLWFALSIQKSWRAAKLVSKKGNNMSLDVNNSVPKHSMPVDVSGDTKTKSFSVINGQFVGGPVKQVDTYPNTDCGVVSTHKERGKDMHQDVTHQTIDRANNQFGS